MVVVGSDSEGCCCCGVRVVVSERLVLARPAVFSRRAIRRRSVCDFMRPCSVLHGSIGTMVYSDLRPMAHRAQSGGSRFGSGTNSSWSSIACRDDVWPCVCNPNESSAKSSDKSKKLLVSLESSSKVARSFASYFLLNDRRSGILFMNRKFCKKWQNGPFIFRDHAIGMGFPIR